MRTISRLLAVLALAACSSGTTIVVRQPAPPPPPPRPRIEPLELALARPVRGQLLVQTNRPAYVAIFEIVPDRGVALLAPSYAHQRTWMLAGLNWVPVSWSVQSTMYYGPPSSRAVPGRWVYAIASDEPLRLPDAAFRPGYLQRVLGPSVYRSANPYVTMRALSRAFVSVAVDEAWAEDAYGLAATYASDPYRTVRIFCANRTVFEVPEELADRAWCPVSGRATGGTVVSSVPARPDSVVASNGQRVRRRLPESRPPVYRVREPSRPQDAPVGGGDRTNTNANNNNAGNNNSGNGVGNSGANPGNANRAASDSAKLRRGGGNAYGHTDDPNVRGRGIENEKQQRQTPAPQKDKALNAEKDVPGHQAGPDPRREPRVDSPSNGRPEPKPAKPDRPAQIEEKPRQDDKPNNVKQEERAERQEKKRVEKQEEKQPEKQQEKQAGKAADKAESKPESAPRSDPKTEKPEPKVEKYEPAPEPQADGNADAKPEGKPDNKPNDKPDVKDAKGGKPGPEGPTKKDPKGKP